MKKSRFTEEQIIGAIRESEEAGVRPRRSVAGLGSTRTSTGFIVKKAERTKPAAEAADPGEGASFRPRSAECEMVDGFRFRLAGGRTKATGIQRRRRLQSRSTDHGGDTFIGGQRVPRLLDEQAAVRGVYQPASSARRRTGVHQPRSRSVGRRASSEARVRRAGPSRASTANSATNASTVREPRRRATNHRPVERAIQRSSGARFARWADPERICPEVVSKG